MADNNDDLYFSFDDEEPAGQPAPAPEGEKGNRGFLIGAILLAAVFVLGICTVLVLVVFKPFGPGEPQVSENQLTNEANMTLFAQTQTAEAATAAAVAEVPAVIEEPTSTPQPIPASPTPTTGLNITPITTESTAETGGGDAGTEAAPAGGTAAPTLRATPTAAGGLSGAGGQGGPVAPTALVQPTARATSGLVVVTPLGGQATLAPAAGGTSAPTAVVGAGASTTGQGGPIQPTLPNTGFSSTGGLAGIGLLAVTLVAVVFVVRRLRTK